jgi:predicted alpha-1,6-mannanase (GH76 family)
MNFAKYLLTLSLCLSTLTAGHADAGRNADSAFDAYVKAFYKEEDGSGWFMKNTDGGRADFWMQAEEIEMVLDVYERTKKPEHLALLTALIRGFTTKHGQTWEHNDFNDDIMWMVIACTRAHLLSPKSETETEWRDMARKNFDLCYARAASPDLGGGLWWKVDNKSKNACVNGPAAIAASLLHKATGEESYLTKAKEIFLWEKQTLFDAATGRVADHIRLNGRVGKFALTYNQGTFIGAANLLGYNAEAKLAVSYTMTELCKAGYLPPADEAGDGGGFNGIGVRWIAKYMKSQHEEAAIAPWLQKNADAAWSARRAKDNLCWCRWPLPTTDELRFSWGCTNAVVLLQVTQ